MQLLLRHGVAGAALARPGGEGALEATLLQGLAHAGVAGGLFLVGLCCLLVVGGGMSVGLLDF